MAYKKVVNRKAIWNFKDDGDKVEGVLIEKKNEVGEFKQICYILENNQKKIHVFGSTMLDNLMTKISVGDKIQIIYKGKRKGKNYHVFEVFKDEDDEEKEQMEPFIEEEDEEE